ncbi:hypothetical protein E2C01_066371 [Portunus trituberculatus]|uniref:Uncharacterized protein n=1 Tax=Portunus trituberculatus TaxID=210409 RepID=A0A5B7HTN7_PORTR|nr:hypothetical protein [Portunus trituberculatus]
MDGAAPDVMADDGEQHRGCCCGLVATLRGLFTRSRGPAGSVARRAPSYPRDGEPDDAQAGTGLALGEPDVSHSEGQSEDSVEYLFLNTAGGEQQGSARPRAVKCVQGHGDHHADSLDSTPCEVPGHRQACRGVSVATTQDNAGDPEVLEEAAEDGPVYWYCVSAPPGHAAGWNAAGADRCTHSVAGNDAEAGTMGGVGSHHAANREGRPGAAPTGEDTLRAEVPCAHATGKVTPEARLPHSYTIWLGHRTPTPLEKTAAAAKRYYAAADRAAARKMAGREDTAAALAAPPAPTARPASQPQVTHTFHLPAACRLGLATGLATLQRRHQVLVELSEAGRPRSEGHVTGSASRVRCALREIRDTLDRITRQQERQARARGAYPH